MHTTNVSFIKNKLNLLSECNKCTHTHTLTCTIVDKCVLTHIDISICIMPNAVLTCVENVAQLTQ